MKPGTKPTITNKNVDDGGVFVTEEREVVGFERWNLFLIFTTLKSAESKSNFRTICRFEHRIYIMFIGFYVVTVHQLVACTARCYMAINRGR